MKFIKIALLNIIIILFVAIPGFSQSNETIQAGEELSKTHTWETTDSKCYEESNYTLNDSHTADWVTFNIDRDNGTILFTGSTLEPGTYTVSYRNNYKVEVLDRCEPEFNSVSFEITVENNAPKINSSPEKNAQEGEKYSYTIEATDPDGDDLSYNLTKAPDWASISGNTISGTPGFSAAGKYDFVVEVSDGIASDSQSFTVTVNSTDRPPSISSSPPTSAVEGEEYSYVIEASDPDGDDISYSLVKGASWLSLDGNHLNGTPGMTDKGDYSIKIRVEANGKSDTQSFTLTVDKTNQAPTIDSSPVKTGKERETYSYEVEASDPDGDDLSYSLEVGPDFLSFDNNDSDNILTGKPGYDQSGEYEVEIKVTDGTASDTQSFTLTIEDVNRAPSISSSPPTSAVGGSKYEYVVNANDPDGDDITYSKTKGPDWLSMSGNTLSGTPGNKVSGSFDITVKASDGEASDSQSFTVTVSSTNRPPEFTSSPVTDVKEQDKYSYQIAVNDPDGDDVSISAEEKAPWMNYSDNGDGTAVLSGTPNAEQSGSYQVTLRASDGTESVDQTFEVTVEDVGRAPKITSDPETYVKEEVNYTYNIKADDPDGNNVSFDYASGPGWLSLVSTNPKKGTAKLKGTPPAGKSGEYTIKIIVTAGEESTTQQYTLEVGKGNGPPKITSDPVKTAPVAKSYRYEIKATDNENDDINFSLEKAPDFLKLAGENPEKGKAVLVGEPSKEDTGKHTVIIKAVDNGDPPKSSQQQFTLNVSIGNEAPVFNTDPVKEVNVGEPYKYDIKATDPDGDDLSIEAQTADGSELPDWLTFKTDGAEATLSGIPSPEDKGTVVIKLLAIDDGEPKQSNKQEFGLKVRPKSVSKLNVHFVYPNACQEKCAIEFALPTKQEVYMKVYSASGELVRETESKEYPMGVNEIEFLPKKLPSGKYSFTVFSDDMKYNAEFTILR